MNEQCTNNLDNISIIKFDGTSVGNADAIERMTGIVSDSLREGCQPVVVLSAMNGTTNRLVRICEGVEHDLRLLVDRELRVLKFDHFNAISDLLIPDDFKERAREDLGNLFEELQRGTEVWDNTFEAVDERLSYGERLMVRMAKWSLLGKGINAEAIDATSIIKTDDNFGEARPDFRQSATLSKELLYPLLNEGVVPVVTGFIGSTCDGKPTTLGRGGSDYSASLLGRFLEAKRVIIYTDVDGVFTRDPNVYSDAKLLPELSYAEADRRAKNGARILYARTVEPLMNTRTELWVKNTFNLSCPGTRITTKV